MPESSDSLKSIERMKVHMELRGLRPNTICTFTNCARRFLAHVGRAPTAVTTEDVEGFLLDLARQARSPRTRNVYLAAIRCLLAAPTGDPMSIRNHSMVEGGVPSGASVCPASVAPAATGLRSPAGSGSAAAMPRDVGATMVDQAAVRRGVWYGSRTTIA